MSTCLQPLQRLEISGRAAQQHWPIHGSSSNVSTLAGDLQQVQSIDHECSKISTEMAQDLSTGIAVRA